MENQKSTQATFQRLSGVKPHRKSTEENPFRFSNEGVMKLLAKGDPSNIADVEELVTLIGAVREESGPPVGVNKDQVWNAAMKRYEKDFGSPHRFLQVPVLRKIFDDIVVDVLSGPVYVDRKNA